MAWSEWKKFGGIDFDTPIESVNDATINGLTFEIPNSADAKLIIVRGGNFNAGLYVVTYNNTENGTILPLSMEITGANYWSGNLLNIVPNGNANVKINFSKNDANAGRISYVIYG